MLPEALHSFQSTPPRGRRADPRRVRRTAARVSIHASAREARRIRAKGATAPRVSIHASAREASVFEVQLAAAVAFQSTPPRGRRESPRVRHFMSCSVSIHASAREARGKPCTCLVSCTCFNPRLRAGGELNRTDTVAPSRSFQSTPPRGRRAYSSSSKPNTVFVSIHASAREASRLPQAQS